MGDAEDRASKFTSAWDIRNGKIDDITLKPADKAILDFFGNFPTPNDQLWFLNCVWLAYEAMDSNKDKFRYSLPRGLIVFDDKKYEELAICTKCFLNRRPANRGELPGILDCIRKFPEGFHECHGCGQVASKRIKD